MIRDVVRLLIAEQERQLVNSIVSQLTDESIELVEWRDLADVEQRLLTEHFRARIFPILTPPSLSTPDTRSRTFLTFR